MNPADALQRLLGRALRAAARRLPRGVQDRLALIALRVIMASAAWAVTRPVRFALNELLLHRGVREYRLRRSGRRLLVRHPMSDAWVVHEVLARGVYDPPPEALRAVAARGPRPRIVDLGAHVGSATLMMLERFPDASVLAVEPNPETAALLRATIARNRLSERCEIREAAAGVAPGSASIEGFSLLSHFVREDAEEAVDQYPLLRRFQDDGAPPRTVAVIDALPLLHGADLVKIDIEGAEWPILQDPRFAGLGVAALVLEYHPQGAPSPDTTTAITELLAGAGFTVGEPFDEHDGVGLLWAWRE